MKTMQKERKAKEEDVEDKKEDIDMSNKNNGFTKSMSDYYTKEYFKKLETGENIKRLFDLEIEERFILGNAIADDRKVYIDEEGYLINDITDNREQYAGTDMNYGMLKILIKEHSSLYYIEKIPSKIDKQVIRDYIERLDKRIKEVRQLLEPKWSFDRCSQIECRNQIDVLELVKKELEDLLEKGDK